MAETYNHPVLSGQKSLVFIHGWGLNAAIWQPLIAQLKEHLPAYNIIAPELPGFGYNKSELTEYNFNEVCAHINHLIPDNSILIGWSLGGLIASQLAINEPVKIRGLITVASSPYFVASADWHGIEPNVLLNFHQQLSQDISKTIDGFLKIQAMGSPHIRHDIKLIRELVMQRPQPTKYVLDKSLELLEKVDLRHELKKIEQPFLRLYGKADSLVPARAIPIINTLTPASHDIIFEQASHAPFISHQKEFLTTILYWLNQHHY